MVTIDYIMNATYLSFNYYIAVVIVVIVAIIIGLVILITACISMIHDDKSHVNRNKSFL